MAGYIDFNICLCGGYIVASRLEDPTRHRSRFYYGSCRSFCIRKLNYHSNYDVEVERILIFL